MKKESNKNIIVLATLFFIASIFVSVPFCKADTKKTLYADRDYIDLKIDDREAKYILDIESKNVGAVDWIGYVSRLDLKEFDSSSDFYERVKDNRTIYTTEGEPLGIVYGEAKSLFRYFDVLSNAIGWAVNRVFGNKIEDTVTIPSDEKNLYLVRVYSGGWGKMVDPNEKSLVREKVYKGDERDKQAMVLNIGTATLDTLGIFIPFTNFVSDDLGEIVAAGFIKASRFFFEPDIVRGVPDLKDLLQITVESGEAMLIKTAEIIKKESTQNFFKFVIKNSKQLVEIVDLPEKISKGGKVVDRITQMLTTATPLETSYVVVGNPLLALEKKEIPEIIEKGGPAALVPPSAVEEKPKEKVSEAQPQLSPSYQAEPLPNGITVENLSIALTKIERKQDYYDSKIDRVYLDFTLRKIKASGESNFNFSFELIDDHGNIYDENNFIHSSLCACSERTIGPTIGLIRTTYCMNSFAPKIDEAPIGFTWTVPLCPYEIPATASLTKVKSKISNILFKKRIRFVGLVKME